MKDIVSVFTQLSVPYFISDGSLLHLHRNCSLGPSDLDFVVQLQWWNRANSRRLQIALQDQGFKRQNVFGQQERVGFEESWTRHEVKVTQHNIFVAKSNLQIFHPEETPPLNSYS